MALNLLKSVTVNRYEVNNTYRQQIADAGLSFSGTSPDGQLVEFVELPREVHPYYIATQAHPELRSRPTTLTPCSQVWLKHRWSARRLLACSTSKRPNVADTNAEGLVDQPAEVTITERETVFTGRVWNIEHERFEYNGHVIARDYVDHTGAVAVLALDDNDRFIAIQQYRHPIRTREWEIPAGLLDIAGEKRTSCCATRTR